MNRVCSIFAQLLRLFPREKFQQAVDQHDGERHARGLTCWGQFAAMLFCQSQVEVIEVGSCGAGIVFYGYSKLGSALEDRVEVKRVRVALEDLAAGGVAEDSCMRIFERAKDAVGHLVDGLVEAAVDACHNDVHLGKGRVVEVEFAFGEDVYFYTGEDADFSFM